MLNSSTNGIASALFSKTLGGVLALLFGQPDKSFGIADRLRRFLEPLASRIQSAVIFGSVARGEQRTDSGPTAMSISC